MRPVSIESFHHRRLHPAVEDVSPVTTVRVCQNSLLCVGLEQLLSDTRFVVWKDAFQDPLDLPNFPDMVPLLFIVDGNHHSAGAVELVKELKVQCPTGRIVVLADQFDFGTMISAQHAGADGFCLTTIGRDVLVKSLELVMLGELVLPSSLVLSMMDDAFRYRETRLKDGATNTKGSSLQVRKLSDREAEILCCLKEGAPNKVIARKLHLAEATVKVHVKAILRKIGVGNRTQAAIWATDHMPSGAERHQEVETAGREHT
jgi:two-component system, NarL family, nitrate/nitrite response regulator NarL